MLKDKQQVYMLVATKQQDRYVTITAEPFTIGEDGGYRGFINSGWDEQKLSDIQVSGQANIDDNEPVYGWRVAYQEPFIVDLPRAEQMVKFLRYVDRRFRAMAGSLGEPESFTQFLARFGVIIGIVNGYLVNPTRATLTNLRGGTFLSASQAGVLIDQAVREYRKGGAAHGSGHST